jgi:hypothetical protein
MNNNFKIKSVALSAPKEMMKPSSRGRGRHIFFGENDMYPQDLLNLLNEAPTAQAIINYTVSLMNQSGTEGNDLIDNVWHKVSQDFTTHGGYALIVGWSRDKSQVVRIKHVPFSYVRAGVQNTLGDVEYYEICTDWNDVRNNPIKTIKAFNTSDIDDSFLQVYYYSRYTPSMRVYPLPYYFSAQNYIELEGELSSYHLKNVKAGFTPTTVITLPTANMSEEEEEALYRGLEETATGREGNRFIVLYGDGTNTPTITSISSLNESAAKDLNDLVVQKILTGFRLNSPTLAGLPGAGSLGGNASEIAVAATYYYTETVEPIIFELEKSLEVLLRNMDDKTFKVNRTQINIEENKENI